MFELLPDAQRTLAADPQGTAAASASASTAASPRSATSARGIKFKYGALGNTVNLASRVQGATKYLKTSLLITDATQACLDDKLRDAPLVPGPRRQHRRSR